MPNTTSLAVTPRCCADTPEAAAMAATAIATPIVVLVICFLL
jgi:hypothetical protein